MSPQGEWTASGARVKGGTLTRVRDETALVLFPDHWQAGSFQQETPDARLGHIPATYC
ncbi:hypothetical protein ACLGIH_33830 [Streptomyces sp. HMX87]|uniref:hypothetical protein n=1 Tax=Streptomyces sp. HMX87 TaxID=3390849 RepID=UPI003A88EB65